ncbi:MAG: hypothetical protein JF591_19010 [Lysobacter sp.]|nr:hypothetical protein [Lysobacter sp.]
MAKAIGDTYFDAAKGQKIADDLRAAARRGEFDAETDPRDLATTLSDRLRPLDHHFAVEFSPPAAAAPSPGLAPATPPLNVDPERRAAYGVRKVEVLGGNLGYIDLRMFADFAFGKPDQPARQAIEAALRLVSTTDAVIIDLRNNGGGSPAMVGYLTSAFTPRGADIYNTFHSRQGTESEAPADWYAEPRLTTPLYILISSRTGSAAEAFAYTLKNAGRAVIVGQTSAGAANPGGMVPVGGGFAVFVSNGAPTSPITHTNWEGAGVQPDVVVSAGKALDAARDLALEAVLKTDPNDTGARWALEALRAEAAPPAGKPLSDYVGSYSALTVGQADGKLFLQRGDRPRSVLFLVSGDTFTVAGEPDRRVVFERDAGGAVRAMEAIYADGDGARFKRDGNP